MHAELYGVRLIFLYILRVTLLIIFIGTGVVSGIGTLVLIKYLFFQNKINDLTYPGSIAY